MYIKIISLSFIFLFQAFLFHSISFAQPGPGPNYLEEIKRDISEGPDGSKPMGKLIREYMKAEGASLEDKFLALTLRKKEALAYLLSELDTGTAYEKRKITKFLRVVRWNEAVPKLLAIAASDQEHELSRISALYALGSIGNKSVAHALVLLLERETRGPTEKRVIIATLARLKYYAAIPSIESFASHENPLVCIFALRALAELGKSSDPGKLLTFLESDDYVIRQEACGALGFIGGTDIMTKLRDIAENDWHEAVRNAAHTALYEIEASGLKPTQRCTFYEQTSLIPEKNISNWAIQKLVYDCGINGVASLHNLAGNNTPRGRTCAVYLILSAESYNE